MMQNELGVPSPATEVGAPDNGLNTLRNRVKELGKRASKSLIWCTAAVFDMTVSMSNGVDELTKHGDLVHPKGTISSAFFVVGAVAAAGFGLNAVHSGQRRAALEAVIATAELQQGQGANQAAAPLIQQEL